MNKPNSPSFSISPNYDVSTALEFFKFAGKVENVAEGEIIFTEDKKGSRLLFQRDKMYLLLEGEVELAVKDKHIGSVRKGEVFGELASITQTARSATAKAKTPCSLITLDDKQLQAALRNNPEFALTLMGIMAVRLRKTIARLQAENLLSTDDAWTESRVFDKKLLADLVEELGYSSRMRYKEDKVIMQEGQAGVLMYVVLEGCVAVTIQGSVVEKVGAGGMFGEMALIGRTERLASAVAETDCSLLAINRNVFLDLMKSNPQFGVALLSAVGERARFMASRHAK